MMVLGVAIWQYLVCQVYDTLKKNGKRALLMLRLATLKYTGTTSDRRTTGDHAIGW